MKIIQRTRIMVTAAALLAALLSGCATKGINKARKEGGRELKTKQLQELVAGQTLHLNQYGETAEAELHPDGTLRAVNYAGEEETGKWAVKDDRLCISFRRWNYGDRKCTTVYQLGEEYQQFSSNGTLVGTFRISAGAEQPSASADREPPAPKPVIQEEPPSQTRTPAGAAQPFSAPDPNAAQDLRFIYREMAQDCPGCDLTGISLTDSSLIGANLAGADLSGANLSKVNLRRANLRGAKLVGTDLTGADLGGADLQGADLTRANLSGANLSRANLKGAVLDEVIGADFRGARPE